MNSNKTKITKREKYNALIELLNFAEDHGATLSEDITFGTLYDFVHKEIELLDGKAAAAQKRAAAKREEGDALREEVYNALSDETYMTIDEIVEALANPNVTRNMVTSRLTQLNNLERVDKDQVSVESGDKTRKVSAYRRKA